MANSILYIIVFLMFLLDVGDSNENESDKIILSKLNESISNDPLNGWLYYKTFKNKEELGLQTFFIDRSIFYPHNIPGRVKHLFYKALKGEEINVAILGGSISAGATLFKEKNEDKIFYHALKAYWNAAIFPITGSKMVVKNYAIGAIGSDFYSYCLHNYVQENVTDLVIWELSANDYHRFDNRDVPPTLPLELLTRNVFKLERQPALFYAHFFRGKDYKHELECNNLESDGANYLARYYRIPSVSWRKLICRKLVANEKRYFSKLFARDNSHPSVLGHAQMGLLLIEMIRKLFLQMIDEILLKTPGSLVSLGIVLHLQNAVIDPVPKPTYKKTELVTNDPICFTFNLPSNGDMPKNQKKVLRLVHNDGYMISTAHGFLVRKDKTEGLLTKEPNKELHIQINVPFHAATDSNEWMILIGSYSNFGGALVFLDNELSRVIETQKYAYGSIVAAVATHVKPGQHDLVIRSLQKGFFLSSVMLG